MNNGLVNELLQHAATAHPNEACGLVVAKGKRFRTIAAKNVSAQPRSTFEIDENAWTEVADDEEVIGIFHSHPHGTPEPSMADLTMCEATNLPWHIVSYPAGGYCRVEPSGFEAPYLKRPYVHGVHDCYSIARDWYNREWHLGLPDFERDHEWWLKGGDLYNDHFAECGFVQINDDMPIEIGDAFLIQMHSPTPNHAAIYVGDGCILHHVQGRLSSKDVYGGMWQRHTVARLRHRSRMGGGNG